VLAPQRQEIILGEVRRRGTVRVSELTSLLDVSDMTVRRDLDRLARRGLLEKVHGGATTADSRSADEPGFAVKSARQRAEKEAIAVAACALVEPGSSIALTAGTTTFQLAKHLVSIPELTVVTNSIPVAEVLHRAKRADIAVVLTGGERTPSDALVGPVAVATLRSLHVDVVFMGVHGMTENAGFTTPNLLESETNRAFVATSEQLVVIADHTKWGIRGLSTIARLNDAAVVVTDPQIPLAARSVLAEQTGRLLIAEEPAYGGFAVSEGSFETQAAGR
jgi:DeoR/GlpR family transcriptional regulator of sugar metabolism